MREKADDVRNPTQNCDVPCVQRLIACASLIVSVLVLAASAQLSFAARVPDPRPLLAFQSFTDHNAQGNSAIPKSEIRLNVGAPAAFNVEYGGPAHCQTTDYKKIMSESLANLIGAKKIDHAIATYYPSLRFIVEHRDKSFPGAPIVLSAVRSNTAWVGNLNYVVAGLALILIQGLVILGLLVQRAQNRKANLRLHQSEERFRLVADSTPSLIWMCDKVGNVTYLNNRRMEFTCRDHAAGLEDAWSKFIHPDDVRNVLEANARGLEQQKGFSKEYRLRRWDGVYRWMLDIAATRPTADGSFTGFIGSAADITDQKLAREALEKIGGKLIEAQEKERSRIARELHDDICQRLALLSMELEQTTNRGSNSSTVSPNPKIEDIRRHCAEIAGDVQALSHRLHSSKLEYLGLVAAIRSFCREFSEQHGVSVEFAEENIPRHLPADISLSLFRVTQEAVRNALKHSGVNHFWVSLQGSANEILLEVSDKGAGFDAGTAMRDQGLGLVSMQERVHLVHGVFTIESTVTKGTRILVRVPLAA